MLASVAIPFSSKSTFTENPSISVWKFPLNSEISENSFDDYIPLIAVCIDIAFGKMNRG